MVLPDLLAHVYIELSTDYIVAYRPVARQRPRNKQRENGRSYAAAQA
jgi:hypothetical protein